MKKVIFLLALLSIVVLTHYFKSYTFDDQSTIKLSSKELIAMFDSNKDLKPMQLNDGPILLKGNVTAIQNSALTLDKKIFCKFKNDILNINIGDSIVLVGNFIGYDNLFQEFKINNCSIVNP